MHHPQVLKTELRLTCCNPQRLGRRSQRRRRSWKRRSGAAALLRALCRCSQWRISLAGLCTAHRQSALSNPPPSAPRSGHRYRNTPCIECCSITSVGRQKRLLDGGSRPCGRPAAAVARDKPAASHRPSSQQLTLSLLASGAVVAPVRLAPPKPAQPGAEFQASLRGICDSCVLERAICWRDAHMGSSLYAAQDSFQISCRECGYFHTEVAGGGQPSGRTQPVRRGLGCCRGLLPRD